LWKSDRSDAADPTRERIPRHLPEWKHLSCGGTAPRKLLGPAVAIVNDLSNPWSPTTWSSGDSRQLTRTPHGFGHLSEIELAPWVAGYRRGPIAPLPAVLGVAHRFGVNQ
jgi:hypothetical protein